MKPIIGKFEKQSWIGKDKDTLLIGRAVEDFDATDLVLGMSLDQIRRLEDCEHIPTTLAGCTSIITGRVLSILPTQSANASE
jgi:hypothetical protein